MKISVIIPTYNEEAVISDCILSLSKQTYPDFEIIVVDDGSSDKTLQILSGLRAKFKNLKVLRQNHKGPGAARNFGAKRAKGEILVFVDADMTFDKDFLNNLTFPIRNGKTKGTFSKEEFVSNWENVWARCWNINEGWEEKRRHPKDYPDFQPVFRAILKEEFDRVGGFTPGGYDDDWSLSNKLGYKASVAKGAIFYHKNPSSLAEVFGHSKWVGKRKYKMGMLGLLLALIRSSFPVSLVIGFYKAVKSKEVRFLFFKLVYDLGIFIGILEMIFGGKKSK